MKAKISNKQEIAEGTLRVDLNLLGEKVNFKPGQYFFVTIPNPPYTDERGNKRHFSIVNSPQDNGQLTLTTRLGPSAFKRSLLEIPLDTEVEVGPIGGSFTLPEDSKPLVFIAGGIGITPFISMIGHIKNNKLPIEVVVIYSNKDQKSSVYLKQLEEWSWEIPDFKLILTMTNDPDFQGEKRRIDAIFLKDYLKDLDLYFYFAAGPPGFTEGIRKVLKEIGVEGSNIKIENFSGY